MSTSFCSARPLGRRDPVEQGQALEGDAAHVGARNRVVEADQPVERLGRLQVGQLAHQLRLGVVLLGQELLGQRAGIGRGLGRWGVGRGGGLEEAPGGRDHEQDCREHGQGRPIETGNLF